MKTFTKELSIDLEIYPLDRIAPLTDILFVDIETTGFTARSSSLYLIGTAYYQTGCWHIRQWFAENWKRRANRRLTHYCRRCRLGAKPCRPRLAPSVKP